MTTKNKPVEMTTLQRITHLVRLGARAELIVNEAKKMMTYRMGVDVAEGPNDIGIDGAVAIWTLATALSHLETENETLKRRLRRDTRKTDKPKAELLKKAANGAVLGTPISGTNGATK